MRLMNIGISDPGPLDFEAIKGIMGRAVSLRIYHIAEIPEDYSEGPRDL